MKIRISVDFDRQPRDWCKTYANRWEITTRRWITLTYIAECLSVYNSRMPNGHPLEFQCHNCNDV